MLLGILGASLLGNLFNRQRTSQGRGTITAGQETIRAGENF